MGGTGSTPSMGTSDLGAAARECGSPFPAFLLAGTCPSTGASCLCQPVSHEHHGEFAQSPSLLPNLSTNEEANSWDGCSAGRSEPLQPDSPMALPMAPSSFPTSLVLWGVKRSWERDAPRKSHVQDGTIDWKNDVPQSRALIEPCLTNRQSLTLHEVFAGLQHRKKKKKNPQNPLANAAHLIRVPGKAHPSLCVRRVLKHTREIRAIKHSEPASQRGAPVRRQVFKSSPSSGKTADSSRAEN